ncbi:hypothetical protein MKX03_031388, partial [Papaver bracteatum]
HMWLVEKGYVVINDQLVCVGIGVSAFSRDGLFFRSAKKVYSGISKDDSGRIGTTTPINVSNSLLLVGKNVESSSNKGLCSEEKFIIQQINGYIDTCKKEISKTVETKINNVRGGIALVVKDRFNRRGGQGRF